MWNKGYMHYHTSFNYPGNNRISPKELVDDLKKLGASFAFCAGDHGDSQGNNYWGLDIREFKEYRDACLSVNEDPDFILIPSPEIHIMFPPFNERHEHHACIPVPDYLPDLEIPESKELAASYTRKAAAFIDETHKRNNFLVFNHPYQSFISPFRGPEPFSHDLFRHFDYMELVSIDWPSHFANDFNFYLKFLSHPLSSSMGACTGIDNACTPDKFLSDEERILPATYFYIAEPFAKDSLMRAYNNRRSYAVYGNLYLKDIHPVPALEFIKTTKNPAIEFEIRADEKRKIEKIEIYRNGIRVCEQKINTDAYCFRWEDKEIGSKENHYIIHAKAAMEHLTTSPINYIME